MIMRTSGRDIALSLSIDETSLPGTLHVPDSPIGVVIFAHGSGSSRFSSRNIAVAQMLNEQHCATYLFDLLDAFEAMDRRNTFDIPLLGRRMIAATKRLRQVEEADDLPIGYFGASTGAAAALVAAAELGDQISAVVSRGGRPDLAGKALSRVRAPTLLLVGSRDEEVIELNRQAHAHMRCPTKLSIIPGATHLFEEPGALEEVARQAGQWFTQHFTSHATHATPSARRND